MYSHTYTYRHSNEMQSSMYELHCINQILSMEQHVIYIHCLMEERFNFALGCRRFSPLLPDTKVGTYDKSAWGSKGVYVTADWKQRKMPERKRWRNRVDWESCLCVSPRNGEVCFTGWLCVSKANQVNIWA